MLRSPEQTTAYVICRRILERFWSTPCSTCQWMKCQRCMYGYSMQSTAIIISAVCWIVDTGLLHTWPICIYTHHHQCNMVNVLSCLARLDSWSHGNAPIHCFEMLIHTHAYVSKRTAVVFLNDSCISHDVPLLFNVGGLDASICS